jgi:hypothetical protein
LLPLTHIFVVVVGVPGTVIIMSYLTESIPADLPKISPSVSPSVVVVVGVVVVGVVVVGVVVVGVVVVGVVVVGVVVVGVVVVGVVVVGVVVVGVVVVGVVVVGVVVVGVVVVGVVVVGVVVAAQLQEAINNTAAVSIATRRNDRGFLIFSLLPWFLKLSLVSLYSIVNKSLVLESGLNLVICG